MKHTTLPRLIAGMLIFFYCEVFSIPNTGFFLPDSIQEFKLKFKTVDDLIILPVLINDSIAVNLVLDTGCRNLVLFGKRFQKVFNITPNHDVMFSGLGSGNPVKGKLSLDNHVSIGSIAGRSVPVVIVPNKNLFNQYQDVHGIIGYDIFLKFEIEIDSKHQYISFRPGSYATAPEGFAKVPMNIVDSRPVMNSSVIFPDMKSHQFSVMIDTGSSLGLLLKTTDMGQYQANTLVVVGRGLNGLLMGYEATVERLAFNGFEINDLATNIVESPWYNHASIGMGILKDYVVVLNYCKSYACFKKMAA